jgi:hypothetical protein
MASNRFVTAIIVFNVFMGLLFFLSSEGMLLSLVGYQVRNVGIAIGYDYVFPPGSTLHPTALLPIIPNYPLFLFIITLIVNLYFVYRVNHKKS